MYSLSHDRFVERLADYEGTPTEVMENTSLLEILVPLMRADFELADTYIFNQNKPKLNCPIHAFGGTDDGLVNIDELDSWKEMSAFDSSFSLIKGGHFFIKSAEEELIQLIKKNVLKSETQISLNCLA